MKTIIYIFLPIIFFLVACEEDSQQSPNEEEVIEEIFFREFSTNEGYACDSLFLKEDSTRYIHKYKCNNAPIFDIAFLNKGTQTFTDTLTDDSTPTLTLKYNFSQISKAINIDKFMELADFSKHTVYNSIADMKYTIKIKTNLREKNVFFEFEEKGENAFQDSIINKLILFSRYHRLRIFNIIKGEK